MKVEVGPNGEVGERCVGPSVAWLMKALDGRRLFPAAKTTNFVSADQQHPGAHRRPQAMAPRPRDVAAAAAATSDDVDENDTLAEDDDNDDEVDGGADYRMMTKRRRCFFHAINCW